MDRHEIRSQARYFYNEELRYAMEREDTGFDTDPIRQQAAKRLFRVIQGEDEILDICRGMIESVAKNVERAYIVDFDDGQLVLGGAIRTGDNILCPVEKARLRDWLAFDEIRERVFREHASKRARERDAIAAIIERLESHGGDATTAEVCSDLFGSRELSPDRARADA